MSNNIIKIQYRTLYKSPLFPHTKFIHSEFKRGFMMETNPSNSANNLISSDIMVNLENISKRFSNSPDLVIRSFQTKGGDNVSLVYFSCLVDKVSINEDVLRPLMFHLEHPSEVFQPEIPLPIGSVQKLSSWIDIEK